MSNIARSIRLEADKERIRLWQLERKKIAEVERQKRLAEKQKQQEAEKKADLQVQTPPTLAIDDDAAFEEAGTAGIRRQRAALILQFAAIVVLPLLALGYYLTAVATPLYQVTTVLQFDQSTTDPSQSSLALPGARTAPNVQQAFEASAFIGSDAMAERLEVETGLLSELSSDVIDPIQRLRYDAWMPMGENAQLKRFLNSSVDVQTGFLTVTTRSYAPDRTVELAEWVVREVTDRQSTQLASHIDAKLRSSESNLMIAEQSLRDARAAYVDLQTRHGMIDPSQEVERINTKIANLESEIAGLEIEMSRNQLSGRIVSGRDAHLSDLKASLTQDAQILRMNLVDGDPSLMDLSAQFQGAKLEIDLAERRLDAAYQAMTTARQSATIEQQVKTVVPATEPQHAAYPSVMRTVLAALIVLVAIFIFARLTIFRPRPNLS